MHVCQMYSMANSLLQAEQFSINNSEKVIMYVDSRERKLLL